MSHQPRKRFGQNFLTDKHLINAILHCFNPKATDKVIEIGPGLGALTKPLLQHLNQLTAIEIDIDLHAYLSEMSEAQQKLHLIRADALLVDFSQFGEQQRIIGNLPYNISTPLLIRLLQVSPLILDMYLMLQKEVAQRLAAPPGSKIYGRLSVMAQYYCEVSALLHVPPTAFHPQPKVDSAVVRLVPYQISPYQYIEFSTLERLVAQSFSMRRKTLANNLKPLMTAADLTALKIDPLLRPEQISVAEYVKIAEFLPKIV
jgi:16S rRNA (adenine1518-N6/adenine1519-N6)-dimethyltransferase